MDAPAPVEKPPLAWQPFTPRGVAAFAQASAAWLFGFQFLVSLLSSGVVAWAVHAAWFPVIGAAVAQLPPNGELRSGVLDWQGDPLARLAEGRCLAFTVDMKHEARARLPAHVQVEFGDREVRVFSLLGFVQKPYPPQWRFPFNREELVPWWGAWSPWFLALLMLGTMAFLMLFWTFLGTVYCVPVWLIAFFTDRKLTLGGSWRLAGAALMPGALVATAAIFLYGLGTFGLIELFAVWGAHWIIGWVYAGWGALRAPRQMIDPATKGNPFA